jgi:CheY-like chemotaxis protein
VELDHSHIQEHAEIRPGSYVMLAMSDTGVGMDTETKGRIFEPFFTTKQRGKGTGLGLSTVYGVVKQSAGYIYAFSEPNKGTTFRVYLPCVVGEAHIIKREETSSLQGGQETILLVEDYPPLRGLAREMLEGLGYTVLDSGRPFEAIRMAAQYGEKIALLITDVVMPEVNGHVLARTLTVQRPGMKVLYTSGYTDDAIAEQCGLEVGRPLLDKPFKRNVLAKRVREILDSRMP